MTELPVVRARGAGMARGLQIGGELSDLIQRSVEFYHRYLERRGVSSATLQDLLTPYLLAAESVYPEGIAVLKGMSIGAMVPVLELFAINAFEELEPLLEAPEGGLLFLQKKEGYTSPPPPAPGPRPAAGDEPPSPPPAPQRCSSLTVSIPGTTLLAHNEHWLAGDLGNVAVVVDVPDGRAAVASPTVVCCLPAVGMNSLGGAQGIGSLTAIDDRVGAPRVLVSRSSLEARDRGDAIGRATVDGRAGGYGHVFAFRGGDTFVVETTATQHRVHVDAHVHTNHYVDGDLAATAPSPSEGSRARFDRLTELVGERRPASPEGLMDILRDHGSHPQAICLHPDPAEGDEASAVLFSMIADVEAGRMWVAAGNPCEQEYIEIDLPELR
jgi:acyl-CoA:6-aminopenicillanic acid acyl transferase